MENTVSFREATMDDFQGVMEIAEIYNGADYLPSKYEEIIKSPHNKCYVSVVNDDIVAFLAACTVDNGETLVTRAGRVKETYRGQGIFGLLSKYVRKQFADFGRVKYETFTTHSVNFNVNKDRIKSVFKEAYVKNVTCYRFEGKHWEQQPLPSDLSDTPRQLQSTDLHEVFASEATSKHLFPNNMIIVDRVPFRILPSNVDLIITPDTLMLGSCVQARSNSDVIYTCLTIGSYYNCKFGLAYVVDVFGNDVTELRHHTCAHVKNVIRLAGGQDYAISIISPLNIVPENIDSILNDMYTPTPIRKPFGTLHVLEKSF